MNLLKRICCNPCINHVITAVQLILTSFIRNICNQNTCLGVEILNMRFRVAL